MFCLTGCYVRSYAAEYYESQSDNHLQINEGQAVKDVSICKRVFKLSYDHSNISELTAERIDHYNVEDCDNGVIKIDNNGKVISAKNIGVIEHVENIKGLSDIEIKQAVEDLMNTDIDFANYNDFSIVKNDIGYYLKWFLRKEYVCNSNAQIITDNEGNIIYFSILDAYSDRMTGIDITNEQKMDYINDLLKRKYGETDLSNITIIDECLSLYNSKDSLICTVTFNDQSGFSYQELIVISQK